KSKGADLLIYNGLELDDVLATKLSDRTKAETLNVGKTLPEDQLLAPLDDDDDDDAKQDDKQKKDGKDAHKHNGKEAHHHHGDHDPHIWLGPPQAMLIADAIGSKLAAIDPPNAAAYKKRTQALKDELKKLHEEGVQQFKGKKSRNIVSMHDSAGY